MLKIVDGIPFIGKATDRFRVRAHDLGNGHVEAVASRVIEWQEADWSPEYMQDVLDCIEKARAEADPDEVEAKNRERAARRARTAVRRLCKAMGADTMLTLTYRANQRDLDLCKRHLKEFDRRVLRVLPGFRAVCAFEPQKRGAWHVHIATAGIPRTFVQRNAQGWPCVVKSYDLLRSIWRSVVGELGGNVDVARRRRNSRKTPAQIAAYIAKYIGKAFANEGDKGKNRWTRFGKVEVPPPWDLGVVDTLLDALDLCYGIMALDGAHCSGRMDRWQDWVYVTGERPPDRGKATRYDV